MKKLMITLFTQSIDALFLCEPLVTSYHYDAVGRQTANSASLCKCMPSEPHGEGGYRGESFGK